MKFRATILNTKTLQTRIVEGTFITWFQVIDELTNNGPEEIDIKFEILTSIEYLHGIEMTHTVCIRKFCDSPVANNSSYCSGHYYFTQPKPSKLTD